MLEQFWTVSLTATHAKMKLYVVLAVMCVVQLINGLVVFKEEEKRHHSEEKRYRTEGKRHHAEEKRHHSEAIDLDKRYPSEEILVDLYKRHHSEEKRHHSEEKRHHSEEKRHHSEEKRHHSEEKRHHSEEKRHHSEEKRLFNPLLDLQPFPGHYEIGFNEGEGIDPGIYYPVINGIDDGFGVGIDPGFSGGNGILPGQLVPGREPIIEGVVNPLQNLLLK